MYKGKMIIDLFAGGGGASTGIEMALGVSPDVAVNHDPQAIALHEANHPNTKHFIEDVYEVNPIDVCGNNDVALLWLSPDCKHFSKAKGAKPVSCNVRSLAWVGIRWAKAISPDVIILENVEEFKDWGPLDKNNMPIKEDKGLTFEIYINAFRKLGYTVEWNELRASDYGAPTIRKRLFIIARKEGEIVWPAATHGDPSKFPDRIPWKTASDCIDWSIPAYSIFMSKEDGKKVGVRRPLADNTMKRIYRGLKKFVIDNPKPYIVSGKAPFVSTFYGGAIGATARGNKIDAPVGTITAGGSRHALVTPIITEHANGSSQRNFKIDEPLRTITAQTKGGTFALVNSFIVQHNLGATGIKVDTPMSTTTQTGAQQKLATSTMIELKCGNTYGTLDTETHEISTAELHHSEVRAYMMKYYGQCEGQDLNTPAHTITSKGRPAVIEVLGREYEVVDIAMRMFTPRELYRAQGFPEDYKINIMYNGKPLSKAAQVRMCGNSVVPELARVLVEANVKVVELDVAI